MTSMAPEVTAPPVSLSAPSALCLRQLLGVAVVSGLCFHHEQGLRLPRSPSVSLAHSQCWFNSCVSFVGCGKCTEHSTYRFYRLYACRSVATDTFTASRHCHLCVYPNLSAFPVVRSVPAHGCRPLPHPLVLLPVSMDLSTAIS